MKNGRIFKIVIEAAQWILIISLIVAFVSILLKFKTYTYESDDMKTYNTIHNDRKIDELMQRNRMLEDSIRILNNDTVGMERYVQHSERVQDL